MSKRGMTSPALFLSLLPSVCAFRGHATGSPAHRSVSLCLSICLSVLLAILLSMLHASSPEIRDQGTERTREEEKDKEGAISRDKIILNRQHLQERPEKRAVVRYQMQQNRTRQF